MLTCAVTTQIVIATCHRPLFPMLTSYIQHASSCHQHLRMREFKKQVLKSCIQSTSTFTAVESLVSCQHLADMAACRFSHLGVSTITWQMSLSTVGFPRTACTRHSTQTSTAPTRATISIPHLSAKHLHFPGLAMTGLFLISATI